MTLLTADGAMRGASWQRDDTIVFATASPDTGLQRVPVAGGTATVLTRPDRARGELDHVWPERLPGGRGALFTILPLEGDTPRVAVLNPETRTWRTLVDGGARARYVESGHLVYVAAGSLWAVRFDLSRLETVGSASEVVPAAALGNPAQFDVAPNGALVYARGIRSMASDVHVPTWVERDGRETPLPLPPGHYRHPRISPDGRRLALATDDGDIYLYDLTQSRTQLARFTFAETEDWFPVWSPDGRRILFGARGGGGSSNLYVQDLDQGVAERLTTSSDMQVPTAITPDGATVLLHSFPKDIQALSLSGPRNVVTLIDSSVEERNIALSRDGRWMAYEGETAGRPGELNVYVRPFPDVGRRVWQITTGGGTFPVWSRDGRELYCAKPDGTTEQGHFVLVQGWTTELARRVP